MDPLYNNHLYKNILLLDFKNEAEKLNDFKTSIIAIQLFQESLDPDEIINLKSLCQKNNLNSTEKIVNTLFFKKISIKEKIVKRKKEKTSKEFFPKMEILFLNYVLKYLENPKNIKELVDLYPFFIDEHLLFENLNFHAKSHPKAIIAFLEDLILAGFPNGINKIVKNNNGLQELLSSLNWHVGALTPSALRQANIANSPCPIFQNYFTKKRDAPKLTQEALPPKTHAHLLTERDITLIQSIPFYEFVSWVKNGSYQGPHVQIMSKMHARMVSSVAFAIVSKDKKERKLIVSHYIEVGNLLLKKGNFYTAQQIAAAFDMPAVSRLLAPSHLKSSKYKKLIKINDLKNGIPSHTLIQEGCLPLLPHLYTELFLTYNEALKQTTEIPENLLKKMTYLIQAFNNIRNLKASPDSWINGNNSEMNTVCWLDETHEQLINEYSSLQMPWNPMCRPIKLPNSLLDWQTSNLARFVLTNTGCVEKEAMSQLFNLKIFSGLDLFHYLQNDLNNIEKLPLTDEQKKTVLCYFAKALGHVVN